MIYAKEIVDGVIGDNTPFKDIADRMGWKIALEDNEIETVYNGRVYLKGHAPTMTLESHQLAQKDIIRSIWSSESENATVTLETLGKFVVDARQKDLVNLQCLIDTYKAPVEYMGASETREVDLDGLKMIREKIFVGMQKLLKKKWEYCAKIDNCETEADVKQVVWEQEGE